MLLWLFKKNTIHCHYFSKTSNFPSFESFFEIKDGTCVGIKYYPRFSCNSIIFLYGFDICEF